MERFISVIIPNYNGGATVGKCLEAALSSAYGSFEVIVVDDCSTDDSVAVIARYPACRLVRLTAHAGAGRARNAGAAQSRGETLFFTDADCLLSPGALAAAAAALTEEGHGTVLGGTYTRMPYDRGFFSIFQSVFINYAELKRPRNPDYIAAHALVIEKEAFRAAGGFAEDFMPLLEDVEFSHRLRRRGLRLVMRPEITVSHIFNYGLVRSLGNGARKTAYWVRYSLGNRDLLADSGTASRELKLNGVIYLLLIALLIVGSVSGVGAGPTAAALAVLLAVNYAVNKPLFAAFSATAGRGFALGAAAYYLFLYPAALWAGTLIGATRFLLEDRNKRARQGR